MTAPCACWPATSCEMRRLRPAPSTQGFADVLVFPVPPLALRNPSHRTHGHRSLLIPLHDLRDRLRFPGPTHVEARSGSVAMAEASADVLAEVLRSVKLLTLDLITLRSPASSSGRQDGGTLPIKWEYRVFIMDFVERRSQEALTRGSREVSATTRRSGCGELADDLL